MSLEERVCFIQAGRFINDISMFNKLLFYSLKAPNDEIELKARNAQSLSILLLIAGKLNECNEFLGKTYGNKIVKQAYEPLLDDKAKKAYKRIRRYFNSRDNVIRKIRSTLAFHHDDDVIRTQLAKVGEDEVFEIYLHEYVGNCLYHISSHLILRHILDMVDPNDHALALRSLSTEMRNLVDDANEFLNDFVRVMAERHGKDFTPLETVRVQDPADIKGISLPYFVSSKI